MAATLETARLKNSVTLDFNSLTPPLSKDIPLYARKNLAAMADSLNLTLTLTLDHTIARTIGL